MKRTAWLATVLVAASSLTSLACAARGAYMVSYAPAPPPPRAMGFVGVAPGPGFVWIDGYWDWRGHDWFWVGGRWARPPYPRAVWVPGNWAHHSHGYRWTAGYWRRR